MIPLSYTAFKRTIDHGGSVIQAPLKSRTNGSTAAAAGDAAAVRAHSKPIIETVGLSKDFGNDAGVFDLDLQVPPGTILGFIGPSGCGKTTSVRLLTGIYAPTAGEVRVMGTRPLAFTQDMRARIGYMPQHSVLNPDLTVWENLNFFTSIYGMGLRRRQRLMELLDFVELTDHNRKLVRQISGGMQRRLGLAATLIHNPELLFLDEPTAGVDPVLRAKFWEHFRQMKDEGRTLFVTTQYIGEAAYCDQVAVMADGRLRMLDTPEGLRRRALGGDAVDLTTEEWLDMATLRELMTLPGVLGMSRVEERTVRLQVEDASTTIAIVVDWCREHNVAITSIQQYLPPFDDVFVHLLSQEHIDHA
jgi:ABC-2 type transport system ATP-binding protein